MTMGKKEKVHKYRIDILEAAALLMALNTWGPLLAGQPLICAGDNLNQVRSVTGGFCLQDHIILTAEAINKKCAALGVTPFVHWVPSGFNIADHVTRGTRFLVASQAVKLDLARLPPCASLCSSIFPLNFRVLFSMCSALPWQPPGTFPGLSGVWESAFIDILDTLPRWAPLSNSFSDLIWGSEISTRRWLANIVLNDAISTRNLVGFDILGSLKNLGDYILHHQNDILLVS
jgi:hypothetical protein